MSVQPRNSFATKPPIFKVPREKARRRRDLPRLSDGQKALAEDHEAHKLSAWYADHFSRKAGVPFEDLEAAGMFGVVRAAAKFDPEHGTRFPIFSSSYIRGSIKREVHFLAGRRQCGAKKGGWNCLPMVSMDEPVSSDRSDSLADSIESGDEPPEAPLAAVDHFERIIACLSERHRELFRAMFLRCDGGDIANAGKVLGISRQRAHQIYSACMEKLRQGANSGALGFC